MRFQGDTRSVTGRRARSESGSLTLGLNRAHSIINFSHRDLSSEVGGDGEVSTVTRISGRHHVLGIEHLRGQVGDGRCSERLVRLGSEGSSSDGEEVETGERNHVDSELAEIGVELSRELSKAKSEVSRFSLIT